MIFCCLLLQNFYGLASSASITLSDKMVEELGAEEKTLKDLQSKGVGKLLELREELIDENRLDRLLSNEIQCFFLVFKNIKRLLEENNQVGSQCLNQ